MRNLITRTIKKYVYTVETVQRNEETKEVKVEQIGIETRFSKVGKGSIEKIYKPLLGENTVLLISEPVVTEETLAMPTEFYVANAKPLSFYKDGKDELDNEIAGNKFKLN